ncbi:F0F1 ATP synthase subunit B [Lachnospiraceae bacterium WCA-693-APC-MOT-I]|uniref:ATP synthase subunit b n=1 Tax=Velocimicrobium porci TaxID=2606634 RepID=A0A6L5Y0W6_9FIRM|nr:F0F1 ATP synthase subunit B [Velocimicrobium porci]
MKVLRLDWNLVLEIINMIVLYLLMKKFLIGPVTAIMEKRQETIEQQLSNAEDANKQALDLKEQYEIKLEKADETSKEIVNKGKQEAKKLEEQMLEDAKKQAERIIKEAEETVALERKKAVRDMESEIAGLAMAAAAKILGENGKESDNRDFYEQFLAKAGESNDTNSN